MSRISQPVLLGPDRGVKLPVHWVTGKPTIGAVFLDFIEIVKPIVACVPVVVKPAAEVGTAEMGAFRLSRVSTRQVIPMISEHDGAAEQRYTECGCYDGPVQLLPIRHKDLLSFHSVSSMRLTFLKWSSKM
jgi:hypothetical protein